MARFSKSDRAQNLPRRTQRRKKNGYIVFYMTMLQTYPTCAVKAVAKRAGQLWNSMSPCEKELYKDRARQGGTRTCRGCLTGAPYTHAHREQDGRLSAGHTGCVLDTAPFNVRPASTEERCASVDPYFYVNTGVRDTPDPRGRYRYVSTSEHCGCRREHGAKVPQRRCDSCGMKPPAPQSPVQQQYCGAVVKRRCRCGAEYQVCRCGKDHHSAGQQEDSGRESRCTCGRRDCTASVKRRSQSRSRREETGVCPHAGGKRCADKRTTATPTNKKRHYSAWYT